MQATALCRSISSFDGVKSANNHRREDHMHSLHHRSLRRLLLASAVMLTAMPAVAADVTPERLTNPEPGNWLMNHRTYDAQRYSPLDAINKTSIKRLKRDYAPAIVGPSL